MWITSRPDGIAVTTAPTWAQVERLLWGEIRTAAYAVPESPTLNPREQTLYLGPDRFAIGLATNEGSAFSRLSWRLRTSCRRRSAGIIPEIWEAIQGIRAGGDVRVLAVGNPRFRAAPFTMRSPRTARLEPDLDLPRSTRPNLQGHHDGSLSEALRRRAGSEPRPYLTTRRWVP